MTASTSPTTRTADIAMSVMVVIWGFHFIVVKDSFSDFTPMQFNALRFVAGIPLIAAFAWSQRAHLRIPRRDVALTALVSLTGPIGYQVFFALGLDRTTATNSALLVATMPVWTALFSMSTGLVRARRQLVSGIGIALAGVTAVVLGRGGASLSLTTNDLVGSGMLLLAAMCNGITNVISKPLVDRTGSQAFTAWKYLFTVLGLVLLAVPDVIAHPMTTFPTARIPHILYSGMLSGVGGFLAMNYALQIIGPTRTASYFNLNPIVAAFAGIVFLGEPVTALLVAGGVLTLAGVMVVRRNTFIRPPEERPNSLWLRLMGPAPERSGPQAG